MSTPRKSRVANAAPIATEPAAMFKQQVIDLKIKNAELQKKFDAAEKRANELSNALDNSGQGEIELTKELVKKISDTIGERVGTAVIDNIAERASKTFKAFPAAKSIALRFDAKELIWTDPDSLHQYVVAEWRRQLSEILQVTVAELDDMLRISVTVPEVKVNSRIQKPVPNIVDNSTDK